VKSSDSDRIFALAEEKGRPGSNLASFKTSSRPKRERPAIYPGQNHTSFCSISGGENPMRSWLLGSVAILGEVVATSALKSSVGFTKFVPSIIVVVGYALAFYFLSLALKSIPLGIAYAVWSGLGIVLVAGIAWFFFYGQKLDVWAFVGMGLIVSGVAVLNLLSKTSAH
jgi:multidrug transporter EmrE-like cation transporter